MPSFQSRMTEREVIVLLSIAYVEQKLPEGWTNDIPARFLKAIDFFPRVAFGLDSVPEVLLLGGDTLRIRESSTTGCYFRDDAIILLSEQSENENPYLKDDLLFLLRLRGRFVIWSFITNKLSLITGIGSSSSSSFPSLADILDNLQHYPGAFHFQLVPFRPAQVPRGWDSEPAEALMCRFDTKLKYVWRICASHIGLHEEFSSLPLLIHTKKEIALFRSLSGYIVWDFSRDEGVALMTPRDLESTFEMLQGPKWIDVFNISLAIERRGRTAMRPMSGDEYRRGDYRVKWRREDRGGFTRAKVTSLFDWINPRWDRFAWLDGH